MCGRYALYDTKEIFRRFKFKAVPIADHYNIAPTSTLPVITMADELAFLQWGITPTWSKRPLINARAETVSDKPSFKKLYEHCRCLVPARGWFEWRDKQPYYFHTKDNDLITFAGLCTDTEYLIITTEAVGALSKVHVRMPLVLDEAWLNPDDEHPVLAGATDFIFHTVSTAVNKPGNNQPQIIAPVVAS